MESPQLDITKILEQAQEELKRETIESVKHDIQWTIERELTAQLAPIVQDFVKTEIAPTLREQLLSQKSEILSQVAVKVAPFAEAVAQAILDQMATNLGRGYQREKIVRAMLGD